MAILLLGPLAVEGAVPPRRRQARLLLALLALDAGREVPVDLVEDVLWPDGRESRRRQIQVLASRLRGHLASWGIDGTLVSGPGGYTLALGPDALDVSRLVDLMDRADQATDPAARFALLDGASALWRGDAVADLPELHQHPEVGRLRARRLRLFELWADAVLAVDRPDQVVERVGSLIDHFPESERLLGLLVEGLYRCGRPSEALDRFRRHADALRARGLEPGPDLCRLEAAILTHDPALDPDRRPPVALSLTAEGDDLVGVRRGLEAALGPVDLADRSSLLAEQARVERDHLRAARHLERALERAPLDDEDRRFDLTVAWGDALVRAGDPRARQVLAVAEGVALASDDPDRLVRVVLARREVGWHGVCHNDPDLLVYEAARRRLPEGDVRRAVVEAEMAGVVHHTHRERSRADLLRGAMAVARRAREPAALRRVLANAMVLDDADDLTVRLEAAHELQRLADDAGDLDASHFAHRIALVAHLETGDLPAMEHHLAEVDRTAEAARQPAYRWAARAWRASVEIHRGALEQAEATAHEAFATGTESGIEELRLLWLYSGQLAEIRRLQGRLPELAALAASGARPPDDRSLPYTPWWAAQPLLALHRGDADEAARLLPVVVDQRLPFDRGGGWGVEVLCVAEAARMLGAADVAGRLHRAVRHRRARWGCSGAAGCGPIEMPLGLAAETAGDLRAARSHHRAASAAARRGGAPVYAALSDAHLARLLLRSDDATERREGGALAAAAIEVAHRHGAGIVEEVLAERSGGPRG